jgi:hypothetical protein
MRPCNLSRSGSFKASAARKGDEAQQSPRGQIRSADLGPPRSPVRQLPQFAGCLPTAGAAAAAASQKLFGSPPQQQQDGGCPAAGTKLPSCQLGAQDLKQLPSTSQVLRTWPYLALL